MGERKYLAAGGIEVFGSEPLLEVRLQTRPLSIEYGEPRRVTIAAFHNHVLAEDALKCKTQSQRGAA